VGRAIEIGGEPVTVVGVMPAGFRLPLDFGADGATQLWTPLATDAAAEGAVPGPEYPKDGMSHGYYGVARLAPGATMDDANRQLAALVARLEREGVYPPGMQFRAFARSVEEQVTGRVRPALLVVFAAVGLVLLIACANAANLLLVQATARRRELALRLALGATRGRVIRELAAEAALLAAAGGVGGVLLAWWGVRGILAIVPPDVVALSWTTIGLDARVLAFAVLTSAATALLFGVGPAVQATRRRPLGGGERAGTGTVEQRRVRGALAAAQLALSMVLLVGAALLMHSFVRLSRVDAGMDVRRLALLDLQPAERRYATAAERAAFYDAVLARVRALPGVRAASVVSGTAGQASFAFGVRLEAEGAGGPAPAQPELLPFGEADPSYFRTLGIPIRQGRAFTAADLAPGTGVAIVGESLARHLWPDGRAVGRRFRVDSTAPWLTVVGVAGDVKLLGPDDRHARFQLYRPVQPGADGQRTVAVRTAGDPAALLPALKAAVYAVDPAQPVAAAETAAARYRELLAKPRFLLTLMGLFAAVAGVLAAVGLYGVVAYTVAQRTREIGIRLAIGAQAERIVGGMVREGARLALVGIATGLVGALALARALASLLFGVSPTDPATLAAVAGALGLVALLATWIPARRASRVDPVIALRVE
jgi:putative ABC transport system permease protein